MAIKFLVFIIERMSLATFPDVLLEANRAFYQRKVKQRVSSECCLLIECLFHVFICVKCN